MTVDCCYVDVRSGDDGSGVDGVSLCVHACGFPLLLFYWYEIIYFLCFHRGSQSPWVRIFLLVTFVC